MQICQEQEQRDRIINRCKGKDANRDYGQQSYSAMINPLMKKPISDLTTASEEAFKTMNAELLATKNLLTKCDAKLAKLKNQGKQIDKHSRFA